MTELPPPGPPISEPPNPYFAAVTLPPPDLPKRPRLRNPFRYAMFAVTGIAIGWGVARLEPVDTVTRDTSTTRAAANASPPSATTTDTYDNTARTLGDVLPATAAVVTPDGRGTGVLITSGELVTNAHVVKNHQTVRIRLTGQIDAIEGMVVGVDDESDLALIRIPEQRITPIRFAGQARLGEPVIAVGYALDLDGEPTITRGIISAVRRTITDGDRVLTNLLQTDTPISSGNSGGPLVNLTGELVGINTAVYRSTLDAEASNIGFAIRSDTITPIIERIRSGQTRTIGYLGVTAGNRDDGGRGAVVIDVDTSSPADVGGLQPQDVIIRVDQRTIAGRDELVGTIRSFDAGATITLTVIRNGQPVDVAVTLVERTN